MDMLNKDNSALHLYKQHFLEHGIKLDFDEEVKREIVKKISKFMYWWTHY